jgi:hypothetical protein
MRDPHVRFCERHGGVISRAYSTLAKCSIRRSLMEWPDEGGIQTIPVGNPPRIQARV